MLDGSLLSPTAVDTVNLLNFFQFHWWKMYYFKGCVCVCVCVQLLSCVRLFANPSNVVRQPPLVHGIFQARMFEWVAVSPSRGSS